MATQPVDVSLPQTRPDARRLHQYIGDDRPCGRARRRSLLLAAIGTAGIAACGPARPAQPDKEQADTGQPMKGGTITESSFADAVAIQPLNTSDTTSRAFENNQYSAPLVRRNPDTLDWETRYGTAESFQVSQDGLTITYRLKSNILWSDARPITAADYKFTWDKMMDPKVDFPYRPNYAQFESLTAPDERTLVFKMKEPFCPAVDFSVLNPIPKHVFENVDINDNPFNQKPTVGSGPWLLQEWVKDSHAVFVANDKFYLGKPHIEKYVHRVVKDQTVQFSMFKAGEVDTAGVRAEDWEEAKQIRHAQLFNYYGASPSWVYIGFNLRNDLLKDVRVRQALTHAIDRQKLVQAIRLGHARPMHSTYAPGSWAYSDDVPKFNFDVERGKRLLDEAGWQTPPGNPAGTRVKDGKQLKMRIFYNAGNKEREQIATVAQQQAKAAGVELEVIAEEWNAYLNRINRTRDMEMYVLGWSAGIEPHGFSNNIWKTDGGQNATGYSNQKVDELVPKGAFVPGCQQSERKKAYAEIQKLVAQDQPYIFLWENEILSGVHNRIVPNKLSKIGYSYRMWEWYSKTGK